MMHFTGGEIIPRRVLCPWPRGSDCACESDGGDSDGQGRPQGGGGVRSTPPQARAAGFFQVFRGQEASFMRKIGTSFRKPSRQNPAIVV